MRAPLLRLHEDELLACMERFWDKVAKGNECWEWRGYISSSGYGQFSIHHRLYKAHRVAWELACGAIPAGLWVLHGCDNRKCVRPDHLFLGTHTDNMRDARSKGRLKSWPAGETHPHAKVTAADVHVMRSSGESPQVLAPRYGLTARAVQYILSGKRWKRAQFADQVIEAAA